MRERERPLRRDEGSQEMQGCLKRAGTDGNGVDLDGIERGELCLRGSLSAGGTDEAGEEVGERGGVVMLDEVCSGGD